MNWPILIVALVGALAGAAYWVMLLRVNWRASAAGKSQFLLASSVLAIMALAVARFSGLDLPDWVRIVVYVIIDIALIGLVVGFRTAQREGRERQRRKREREEVLDGRS